ncbi:uncharacterized protein MKZ38_009024 [Zalerion maritima]|uniref:S-adenosyl-L-methionine-dependent methyltransferase n=1 Tax=Zalerion maritima TaxID=339359 RepID=A0AAD5RTN3_9PEZI|nr:uncharacterized protein MKZ38_009024 [Zalerion maritima]
MPRLPFSLIRRAHSISPNLSLLLLATRSIPLAKAELRWLRDHVAVETDSSKPSPCNGDDPDILGVQRFARAVRLRRLCKRRSKGEPLQYILGTQPFWPLEILCRKGVLIPRQETEASTHFLASRLNTIFPRAESSPSSPSSASPPAPAAAPLKILDICTGTGCISLLLAHLLANKSPSSNSPSPEEAETATHSTQTPPTSGPGPGPGNRQLIIRGIDISPRAISLARKNILHNSHLLPPISTSVSLAKSSGGEAAISFRKADILIPSPNLSWCLSPPRISPSPSTPSSAFSSASPSSSPAASGWDVVTANPPYISPPSFSSSSSITTSKTARSVRNWEPKLALVPPAVPISSNISSLGNCSCEKHPEDIFYARILHLAASSSSSSYGDQQPPRVIFFEVGDLAQAIRVVELALCHEAWRGSFTTGTGRIEVWRDVPDMAPSQEQAEGSGEEEPSVTVQGREIPVLGTGEGRSVFIQRY